MSAIRPEEWILLGLWGLGWRLCVDSGTGFDFIRVFESYVRYFATYVLGLYAVSRAMALVAERWRPSGARGRDVRRFFFGSTHGLESLFKADVELNRGLTLLFANLAVYSNIKLRIPAINDTVGDALFIQLDGLLFGEHLASSVEKFTASTPWFARYLSDIYIHGYFWMIVLVYVAYIRRDVRGLRWIFGAITLTYITAILITAAYPSYGPFFLEPERFEWMKGLRVNGSQKMLRRVYAANIGTLEMGTPIRARSFAGIAAFPSLHIGHMVVMLLIAIRMLPVYALIMIYVTGVTFIATIAFGWHYAVDAVGGIIVATVCTCLVGWFIRRGSAAMASLSTAIAPGQ